MFTIPEYVNWNLFGPFLTLVIVNLVFGIFCICFKFEKKILFKIIGNVLVFAIIGFFLYLAYTNDKCQDYDHYMNIYNKNYSEWYTKDKGFLFLADIMYSMGFSYSLFRFVIYAISYTCIFIALTAYKTNKNFVFALYAIYPWSFHAFQMRNCLGFAIVMIATIFLLFKEKWKILGFAMFTFFVGLATSIHASMLLYAIFFVIFLSIKKKNYFIAPLLLVSLVFIAFYFNNQNIIVELIPESIQDKFFNGQYTANVPNYREYISLFIAMVFMLMSGFFAYIGYFGIFSKKVSLFDNKKIFDNSEENTIKCLFFMTVCMFCLIITITFNTDFFRLQRNFVLFLLIMISLSMRKSKLKILNPCILLSIVCLFYAEKTLLEFSNSWETGGITMFFWVFFI